MDDKKTINRRKFLKIAGWTIGGLTLTCIGAGVAASQPPIIQFYETKKEMSTTMTDNVLIAYASKAGSTSEIMKTIADTLTERGKTVEVSRIGHAGSLDPYQTVIIASCIRMGAWLPEAVNFVKDHQAELSQKTVAYVVVNATLREDTSENRQAVNAYIDPVRAILQPADVGLFAGKIDFSRLSFMDRTIAKMVGSVEGDYRDWDAIRSWANELKTAG
jgi:menaquinone-dependent protoporphyrinogen oxidase